MPVVGAESINVAKSARQQRCAVAAMRSIDGGEPVAEDAAHRDAEGADSGAVDVLARGEPAERRGVVGEHLADQGLPYQLSAFEAADSATVARSPKQGISIISVT